MSEHDVTVMGFGWPQQRTGPDGTTYWVDSAGEVFSAAIHMGPEDDSLGVDDTGRWVKRPQERSRRGWQKGKPRGPRKSRDAAPPELALPPVERQQIPSAVWVIWHAESGQLETVGAFADPIEALERLIDTPGGRVSRALIQ